VTFRSLAFLTLVISVLLAGNASAQNSQPAEETGHVKAVRSGYRVELEWSMPKMEVRLIELMRNNTPSLKGRGRVASVRGDQKLVRDIVPDVRQRYWYWLKLTLPDNSNVNYGPFEASVAPL
jgi:hypothetical protein